MVKMQNWTLKLGTRIVNANHHRRFVSAIVTGERGYGKSMYCLKIMAFVYLQLEGLSEKEAWLKALDYMIFDPHDYMKKIAYNYDNDIIDPVWTIDDAGVYFTGMMFFRNMHLYGLVSGSFDTLRTVTNGMLITCPYKKKLMTGLRQYDDRDISLYVANDKDNNHNMYNRKAVCIKWYRLPSGTRKFRKDFEDHFSCYVPKWIYQKYLAKRRKYNKQISNEWEKRIKKLDKKKNN